MSTINNYIILQTLPSKITGDTRCCLIQFDLDVDCVVTENDLTLHTTGIDDLHFFRRIELYYNNIIIAMKEFNNISIKLNDGVCKLTDIFNDMKFSLPISKDKKITIRMFRNEDYCEFTSLKWYAYPNSCTCDNVIYGYREYIIPIIDNCFTFIKEPMTEIKGIYIADNNSMPLQLNKNDYKMNTKDNTLYDITINNKNKLPFVLIKAIKLFKKL